MSDIIRLEGISKSYYVGKKEIQVLKNVNFTIQPSQMVSIVGASGAGKSTLLHIMGALDAPTQGFVLFEGESIFEKKQSELALFRNQKIGFVFQFHHLLSEFSAIENVMMPALIKGTPWSTAKEIAEKKLGEVGLKDRLQHKPGELSGGEQQRVAIARAIVLSPSILLADELTGNLDTKTGEYIIELLLALNQENGMTMIMVTHNETLAKKAAIQYEMSDGFLKTRL